MCERFQRQQMDVACVSEQEPHSMYSRSSSSGSSKSSGTTSFPFSLPAFGTLPLTGRQRSARRQPKGLAVLSTDLDLFTGFDNHKQIRQSLLSFRDSYLIMGFLLGARSMNWPFLIVP